MTIGLPAEPPSCIIASDRHNAASCRWATPTVTLPPPLWFDAENSPWSCMRDAAPRVLITTDVCGECPRWEPRYAATPFMVDWFCTAPPPHETD